MREIKSWLESDLDLLVPKISAKKLYKQKIQRKTGLKLEQI